MDDYIDYVKNIFFGGGKKEPKVGKDKLEVNKSNRVQESSDNLAICKVEFSKKYETIEIINYNDKIPLTDISIYDDDTNQMVLNKIANAIKCPPEEIFAWYETEKNDNIHPIGFNYTKNPIGLKIKNKDDKDDKFLNFLKTDKTLNFDGLIDNYFVNSDGNKIQNSLENKYNDLFENNLDIKDIKDYKIYFRTLEDFFIYISNVADKKDPKLITESRGYSDERNVDKTVQKIT